ncbi:MAG: hypothetical protein ABII68_03625 [Pseudomonadota bacterium]
MNTAEISGQTLQVLEGSNGNWGVWNAHKQSWVLSPYTGKARNRDAAEAWLFEFVADIYTPTMTVY